MRWWLYGAHGRWPHIIGSEAPDIPDSFDDIRESGAGEDDEKAPPARLTRRRAAHRQPRRGAPHAAPPLYT